MFTLYFVFIFFSSSPFLALFLFHSLPFFPFVPPFHPRLLTLLAPSLPPLTHSVDRATCDPAFYMLHLKRSPEDFPAESYANPRPGLQARCVHRNCSGVQVGGVLMYARERGGASQGTQRLTQKRRREKELKVHRYM